MKLVAIAALIAVCGAAKLDRTYLPPSSAHTAGGSSDSLQTPLSRSSPGQGEPSGSLPTGSYTNNFQGVVVDAAAAGIRTSSDGTQSGLGGSRETYGSTNSKVGDAAFRGSVAGFRNTQTFGSSGLSGTPLGINAGQHSGVFESKPERPQAHKDRNSNIITYANDVSSDNYSYGFETDNGIAIGENGVANNGIQAQGGYSYKGDDGQVYKVTYVADEGGYRPQGAHLPTPPPIPKEILESLEQNAKEEAAGLVDDGSYDAQKYNAEGDYTHHNGDNTQYNGAQLSQFAKRPESDASASNTFINQNHQAFGKPGQLSNIGTQNPLNLNGQSNQFSGNKFNSFVNNNQNGLAGSQDKQSSQTLNGYQQSSSTSHHSAGNVGHHSGNQVTSQFGQTQGNFAGQNSQFETQNNQQDSGTYFGSQFSQFGSSGNQGSVSQFGAQPTKPTFGQSSNTAFNYQSNQGTQFGNQALKPQGSFSSPSQAQNGFEKPSQYNDYNQGNSHVSQNHFGTQGSNKPSFGSFGSNKPSPSILGQGQSNIIASNVANNGNHVPNTQFGAGYLPPFNKPQSNDGLILQDSNKDSQIPNFGQNQGSSQGSSSSSVASVSQVGFGPQPAKPSNTFQSLPSRPNQFNYNSNNQLTSQGQTVSNALPISSEHSASQAVSSLPTGDKPTAIPEIELTTPLESNERPTSSQGSQFNSQSSSFGNFGSQSLHNQGQPQNSFPHNDAASQQHTSQTLLPPFSDSRPQGSSQFVSASPTQAVFSTTAQPGSHEEKPQFSQSTFSQNQQNSAYYSTQKPSFSQGPDDSYYYNQPSRPFSTPTARPEGIGFPSTPSYQSNGVASSQNNQFTNQQGSLPSSTKFPSSPSLVPAAPTSPSQFTQTQGSSSSNYYNGITQASISPFPPVSPTTSSQYHATQGSIPNLNQPLQFQQNKPTISQVQSDVPSFPSNPTSGQSSTFTQSQIQFGQASSTNKDRPSASFSSNSVPAVGQTPAPSITQNQIQFGQNPSVNNDQPQTQTQTPDISQQQQTISNQQYQGTIYEYNKPAEVLPASEQTDSSSSQNIQTDVSVKPQGQGPNNQESKPQFGSQQTQFGQTSFSSQSQQFNVNQGTKPQASKPFGISPSSNIQSGQNTQSTVSQASLQQNTQGLQGSVQPGKPNESTSFTSTQFGQTSQVGFGSRPQHGSQPAKPFASTSSPSHFGQNTQKPQGVAHTSGFTGSQSGVQSFKPFGSEQTTTTQFGQNTQTGLGSQTSQQGSGYQYGVQSNKPFGRPSSSSQFGQSGQTQGSYNTFSSTQQNTQSSQTGAQPFKPFGTTSPTQSAQTVKPFGTTGTSGFQGYPSSKPQFGTQLTQTNQQSFEATQIASQPARVPQAGTLPTKPFGNSPSIHSSPDFQKPQFGQNTQLNQGSQSSGTYFGQQSFQGSQFGSAALKPQIGSQTQFGQNLNDSPIKPIHGSPSLQKPQFGQNTQLNQGTQSSGSSYGQQTFQSTQFGSSAAKPQIGYQPQLSQNQNGFPNKPQFGQNTQLNQGTQSSGSSYGQQSFQSTQFGSAASKPQIGSQPQFTQNQNYGFPNKPINDSPASQKPQFGQNSQLNQGTQSSGSSYGQQSFESMQLGSVASKPQIGSQPQLSQNQNGSPNKPIHGSPDSQKPQFGQNTQLNQGTQSSGSSYGQQSFQSTQFGSAASKPQIGSQTQFGQNQNVSPIKPTNGSPDSQKPQFGQNTQLSQGTQSSGSSYSQQSFQSTQFGSEVSKPQVGSQTAFGLNQTPAPFKPFGSTSSQAQVGQNSAQASSSTVTQEQPQNAQGFIQGSSFSTQNKAQYNQASQGASTTSFQSQLGAQAAKPFNVAAQGSQDKPGVPQNKPFGAQQGSSCCQDSQGSPSIGPLNVGKPSQAFAQTQSQFSGFQGAQGFDTQSVAGKGEEFGGPRQPPSFDAQTGYHY